MLHFPSTLTNGGGPNGVPRRVDSLNATQQKPASHPLFLTIEEELHDARRVQSHGQEEDLRSALNMVINRVTQLSSLLNEAYKSTAELELQLNVAKSNLQLVISNNEMLEEALKRENKKDVGWRRGGSGVVVRESSDRPRDQQRTSSEGSRQSSVDSSNPDSPPLSANIIPTAPLTHSPVPPASAASESRFFKFRFTGSSSSSRPSSPVVTQSPNLGNGYHHLTSPSMPTLSGAHNAKEMEELNAQLEKERAARKTISKEKEALEAEIESLSQALFEEANKMVATERIKRAETEEELKEAKLEKEALRSALRLIEGENINLRTSTPGPRMANSVEIIDLVARSRSGSRSHSRSSSRMGTKSTPSHSRVPSSSSTPSRSRAPSTSTPPRPPPLPLDLVAEQQQYQLPPPFVLQGDAEVEDEVEPTPRRQRARSRGASFEDRQRGSEPSPSPWADTPSQNTSQSSSSLFAAAAVYSMR